jgi:hypothetical protein
VPYNAPSQGRFYLFFMRLPDFLVTVLYMLVTIQWHVR